MSPPRSTRALYRIPEQLRCSPPECDCPVCSKCGAAQDVEEARVVAAEFFVSLVKDERGNAPALSIDWSCSRCNAVSSTVFVLGSEDRPVTASGAWSVIADGLKDSELGHESK